MWTFCVEGDDALQVGHSLKTVGRGNEVGCSTESNALYGFICGE